MEISGGPPGRRNSKSRGPEMGPSQACPNEEEAGRAAAKGASAGIVGPVMFRGADGPRFCLSQHPSMSIRLVSPFVSYE